MHLLTLCLLFIYCSMAWRCLEWTLLITSWKSAGTARESSRAFPPVGSGKRWQFISPRRAISLRGREGEGLRGPGVKTFCRGLTCCSGMSKTGSLGLPHPLFRPRGYWSVTIGLHLLARGPCPGPTPCLKAKTSNSDLDYVHHLTLYGMILEPLTLLISHELCIIIPILQN